MVLVLLFTGIVRFRLLELPLERDEGEFAYAGQLMLKGIPPYREVYFMKLPGTHAMYAVIMAVFGQTPAGIHLGLWLVNAATSIGVFLLGRRLVDPLGGLIAGATFALISVTGYVYGLSAHATHFVVFFSTFGFWTLFRAIDSGRRLTFFLSGLVFGLSGLMKQPGLFFFGFGALTILWIAWENRPVKLEEWLPRLLPFLIGGILPYLLTLALIFHVGVFEQFWFWTVKLLKVYGTINSGSEGLGDISKYFGIHAGPSRGLWVLALTGFGLLVFAPKLDRNKLFILGLAVVSAVATSMALNFRVHYFILMLPAVALLVSAGVSQARQSILNAKLPAAGQWLPYAIFAFAAGWMLWFHADYLFKYTPAQVLESAYAGNPFGEAQDISKFVTEHTAPTDRIAVLGSEPEIYFYAGRRGSTGCIYTYEMMRNHPLTKSLQDTMRLEIEAQPPKIMLVVKLIYSWLPNPQSDTTIIDWGEKYCQDHYELIGVVDYRMPRPRKLLTGSEVSGYNLDRGDCVFIFQRKAEAPTDKQKLN